MKKVTLSGAALIPLLLASPVMAQQAVTPNFTQGSMTSTTNIVSKVTESIVIDRYGGDYYSVTGTNATASGPLLDPTTTYSMSTPGSDFSIEQVARSAGIIETETINRTIDITQTTNSVSIFSQ